MKNGRGNVYDDYDDKYDKLDQKRSFKTINRLIILGTSILSICILYYFYIQKGDVSITKDLDTTIIEHETTSNVPIYPDEIRSNDEIIFEKLDQATEKPLATTNPILFTQYPPPKSLIPQDQITASRQKQIVDAFRHAWKGYSQDAFGKDEYQPLTHSGRNWIPGGIGLMMIDSLDTLMLMNLTKEYKEVRSWIATQLDFNKDQDVNVFETTIRVLGGLLSAYHLSNHDSLYLEKAVDLGDRLLQAFNTDSGIPYSGIKLSSGKPIGVGPSSTAEATTIQLEFKYLSHLTGDMKYWKAAEKVMERIHELVEGKGTGVIDGLVPIYIDAVSGNFVSGQIRLGSRGDSYYEYLLKQYLQTNKTEIKYRERYDHAIDGIKKHLIQYSYPNQYLYIAELLDSSKPKEIYPKMDHLVCFMGGSFVLGATEGKSLYDLDLLTNKRDREDFQLGQGITKTCYHMYNMTATGLASEIVYFNTNPNSESKEDIGIHKRDTHNLLRPETVESLFLLYRITGDEKYREWGWNIFESFEKHTKLPEGGYAALKDVTHIPAPMYNRMDTFYLAETLKYLYLLFSPNDIIPLGQYVFNTEAHPLPIFTP